MNSFKKIILVIFLVILIFGFFPSQSWAAWLVPCGVHEDDPETPEYENCPCTFCHFFVLFNRIVNFIVWRIVPWLGLIMLIAGGIMFIMASGNPEMLSRAKKFILAAIAGLFIIYAAWLILHTVFTVIQVEEWTGIAEGGFSLKCDVPGRIPADPDLDPESPEYKKKYGYICEDVNPKNCICDAREKIQDGKPPPGEIALNPNSGEQGESLALTIIGTNANFKEPIEVKFKNGAEDEIEVRNIEVDPVDPNILTCDISIAGDATLGKWDVSVIFNSTTLSCEDCFTVTEKGAPKIEIAGVRPSMGARGESFYMIISGDFDEIKNAETIEVEFLYSGNKDEYITVEQTQLIGAGQINIFLNIAGQAGIGNHDIVVRGKDASGEVIAEASRSNSLLVKMDLSKINCPLNPNWEYANWCYNLNEVFCDPWGNTISQHFDSVSSDLQNLLSCMRGKMEKQIGIITSISDTNLFCPSEQNPNCQWDWCSGESCATCATCGLPAGESCCNQPTRCQHGCKSCHYGGRYCGGESYAVDFGDETNCELIKLAAQACGATNLIDEGDHIHVSIKTWACGCNENSSWQCK